MIGLYLPRRPVFAGQSSSQVPPTQRPTPPAALYGSGSLHGTAKDFTLPEGDGADDAFASPAAARSVVAFGADASADFEAAALAAAAATAGSIGTHSPFLHRPPPSFAYGSLPRQIVGTSLRMSEKIVSTRALSEPVAVPFAEF